MLKLLLLPGIDQPTPHHLWGTIEVVITAVCYVLSLLLDNMDYNTGLLLCVLDCVPARPFYSEEVGWQLSWVQRPGKFVCI